MADGDEFKSHAVHQNRKGTIVLSIILAIPLILVFVLFPLFRVMIMTYFNYRKSVKSVHPAFREQAKAMWRKEYPFLPDITIKD